MTVKNSLKLEKADLPIDLITIPESYFLRDGELVTVPEFWVSKYHITQKQYTALTDVELEYNEELKPITRVNWYMVSKYCERLSEQVQIKLEIPTANQIEVLLREGSYDPLTVERLDERKDLLPPEYQAPHDVTLFKPDYFGVCGVTEGAWCWTSTPDDRVVDGIDLERRVIKGIPKYNRYKQEEIITSIALDFASRVVGFRVVHNPTEDPSYLSTVMNFLLN